VDGSTPVEALSLQEQPEPVYNIEGDHCYRVGEQGLLARNMSPPNPSFATPAPGTIPQTEVFAVRASWLHNSSSDIGLGLYNPCTGEIHVGTFDTTGQRLGHDGLQMTLGIPDADRPQWRGFVFTSAGQAINMSGFNAPDGTPPRMRADYYAQVEDALRRAGLN
jgi:hypothetical protein